MVDTRKKQFPRSPILNFKTLIILFIVIIGIILILPKVVSLQEAVKLLAQVNKPYLLLALLSAFITYSAAAWLLGIILSRTGFKLSFIDRFRIGSIAAFAMHFLPIGTIGEGALDYYFLRAKHVKAGSILITLILRIILTYSAFLLLFLISLLVVPITHASLKLEVAVIVLAVLVVAGVIYLYYLYRNKKKFRSIWNRIISILKKPVEKIIGKPLTEQKKSEVFEDIYKGLHLFSRKKRFSALALLAGLLYWLGDITCFFFVFLSFGYLINFGTLIFSYTLSTLAGMISLIPGGLGVTEGSLGLLFNSFSVPLSVAVMSILVFRLLSFWIWIPIGFVSYITMAREIAKES